MKSYSIAIMTFNKRFDIFKNLIKLLRNQDKDVEIIVGVNCNYNESFDQNFRKKMLQFLSTYDNIYPIFFPQFRGCSKIWNTMFINSNNDNILFLSDDVAITNTNFLNDINTVVIQNNCTFTIKSSYSFYVINRLELNEIGWFDERLLGFGEEDGDFIYRYIKHYNHFPKNIHIQGIDDMHLTSASNFTKGIGKYTKFNRDWIFSNKYVPGPGIQATFSKPHKDIGSNTNLYPYEQFFWNNKDKL